ncbi:MAG: TonB-dependent receptor, partial [bacterium]|nr:TonB-dependent receptor [bacterium]
MLGLNLFRYRLRQLDADEQPYFISNADEWERSFKIQHYWVASKTLGVRSGASAKFIHNDNSTSFADTIYDRNGNRIPAASIGLAPSIQTNTEAQKLAAFWEVDWLAHPRLNLKIGLRLDHYQFLNQKNYFGPRASIKYKIFEKHTLRTSGGIYYQSPSYVWIVNPFNKNLKALKNQMGVLAWDYLIKNDLRFSIEGYYKKYSQLPGGVIARVTDHIVVNNTGTGFGGREDDFQSFGYFDLTSNAKGAAYGAEFLLQKKFSQIPLYGLLSLSYGKVEITANNGITYPGQYDQRFILNASGGYIFNSKWEISMKFRYFTGVPHTPVYRPSENPMTA